MEPDHRIGEVGLEELRRLLVFGDHLLRHQRLGAEGLEGDVVHLDPLLEPLAEIIGLEGVAEPDADPRRLVAVGGTDAPLGRPDLALAALAALVDAAVVGEDQMGGLAQEEAALGLDPPAVQPLDLLDQRRHVDDHAVADHAGLPRPEDAGGDQLEDELLLAHLDGVARVVAALAADHHVDLAGQHVDDLALALVAPLGAH